MIGPADALVLVVDDNVAVCRLIATVLEPLGARVEFAHDGRLGQEMALRLAPDLLMVDHDLPFIDGPTIIRHVRATESGSDLPIIAMTGGGASAERDLLGAGATVVLEKPFLPSVLAEHVRPLLSSQTGLNHGLARP